MSVTIVTEKSSFAEHMATALGGMQGTYQGCDYEITHLNGHLYKFVDPEEMVPASLRDRYYSWDVAKLPWTVADLSWARRPRDEHASGIIRMVNEAIGRADEVVIATDLDPTGEGDLLFWEVIDELGLHTKTFSRMEFTDEMASSLQHAFTHRRPVTSMQSEGAYRKALYRAKFDYLSIQFTRIATAMAESCGQWMVVRQGRLKSAMVALVGDQLKAVQDYVKKPFFQNRFRDENGVIYTHAEEPTFPTAGEVPQVYRLSTVVHDGVERKHTSPPKLIDLSTLATILAGRGVSAKTVLNTYQSMYEKQLVSYPRTEDKTITPEQFNELAPLANRIAGVVGVDPVLLTHREPRSTHVKATGAHGANRPGPVVPASLAAVRDKFGKAGALIYEVLAKSYLAMLGADYEYDRHTGHVQDYPLFVGSVNVPQVMGWRAIFDPDPDETDEDTPAQGLGEHAAPFIHEGANPKPAHPTMKWLMKQLEKRTVGTGATRTSTYTKVISADTEYPLLVEGKGTRLSLAPAGEISWHLLPHTHIGDLGLTEQVYATMKAIEAGTATIDDSLAVVAQWVRDDLATMQTNMVTMRDALSLTSTPRASGTWAATGEDVSFSRSWGGHEFSDDEVSQLLDGKTISFSATSKDGRHFLVSGKLGHGTYEGHDFIGFQKETLQMTDANGEALPEKERAEGVWATTGETVSFTREWASHRFTDEEVTRLLAGETIDIEATSKTGQPFMAFGSLGHGTFEGKQFFGFQMEGMGRRDANGRALPPNQWCGHVFTLVEIDALTSGKSIEVMDCISSNGNTFACMLEFKSAKPGEPARIVPDFTRSLSQPPTSWCGVTFTPAQRDDLAAGKPVAGSGFVSKAGKKFDATVRWIEKDGRKQIVPEFAGGPRGKRR